ncbi:MAG: D-alanine--D-alanine ligase [Phycisphaeraceae bacterium]|nr:MAG: D-alanine--D-alanine ligase [Phycisphaeraceae bacterium]
MSHHPIPGVTVLVLGGGPDAERPVSLISAKAVADALTAAGWAVHHAVIDRPSDAHLAQLPGDVVFPVLHGGWGEGGPLQDLLERAGRPYVGSPPGPARLAMDKVATKMAAVHAGIPTAQAAVLNTRDEGCPLGDYPVVVKPVHEGSSVGVHICRNADDWRAARKAATADAAAHPGRVYMVERAVLGDAGARPARELTVGVLDLGEGPEALDIIEIVPAEGFYDYKAKYERHDTTYTVNPPLPPGVRDRVRGWAVDLFRALGCRDLARVDFLLDQAGNAWLLEVNTMPGFTDHSLLPRAAQHAGIPMGSLCGALVRRAWGRRASPGTPAGCYNHARQGA